MSHVIRLKSEQCKISVDTVSIQYNHPCPSSAHQTATPSPLPPISPSPLQSRDLSWLVPEELSCDSPPLPVHVYGPNRVMKERYQAVPKSGGGRQESCLITCSVDLHVSGGEECTSFEVVVVEEGGTDDEARSVFEKGLGVFDLESDG